VLKSPIKLVATEICVPQSFQASECYERLQPHGRFILCWGAELNRNIHGELEAVYRQQARQKIWREVQETALSTGLQVYRSSGLQVYQTTRYAIPEYIPSCDHCSENLKCRLFSLTRA
jgi:hypothetical protein